MNSFKERLAEAMKDKKMSQAELAKRSGIGRNSINDYLKGKYEAKQDKVHLLATTLNVSESWLMGFDTDKNRIHDNQTVLDASSPGLELSAKILNSSVNEAQSEYIKAMKVPVVSKISAGFPIYSEENILEYAFIPAYLNKKDKEYFYLKVSGDSMNKEFNDGDLVLIEKDSIIENGQIGVVMINGYNATVKRVRYNENQIILYPESSNPEHLPQIYTMDDSVKCIGKVISVQKFY